MRWAKLFLISVRSFGAHFAYIQAQRLLAHFHFHFLLTFCSLRFSFGCKKTEGKQQQHTEINYHLPYTSLIFSRVLLSALVSILLSPQSTLILVGLFQLIVLQRHVHIHLTHTNTPIIDRLQLPNEP